jgi:hypothetical protein
MHSESGQQRHKKEEERIRQFLKKNGVGFESELRIDFKCVDKTKKMSYAVIDVVINKNNGKIILEIDENQHRFGDYSVLCDMERMSRIQESTSLGGNNQPILFIRYNPMGYKVDGKPIKKDKNIREEKLLENINQWNFNNDSRPLSILYMYYDVDEGVPLVTLDNDYHEQMRQCVVDPVF